MFEFAKSFYRVATVVWVDFARRRAGVVALLALAATVVIGWYAANTLTFNTDTGDMLSRDLEYRRQSRALSDAFPQFSDNVLIVVEGATPDLADDAAAALAKRLRARPELFGEVFDPAGDPFFRRNGLLFLEVDELSELADRLAEAQPFLGTLWRDRSLRGLFEMLELAIEETLDSQDAPPFDLADVMTSIAEVAEAEKAGRFAVLSWQEMMRGEDADASEWRRYIVIQPALDFSSLQPASRPIAALRQIVDKLGLDQEHGISVRLTGAAALDHDELKSVEEGMGLAGIMSLTLVLALLFIGLGSLRLTASVFAALIMGLVWTAGFAAAAIGELNLISVAFAVLFIGLSVDFGIHFGLRYQESIDRGADNERALANTATGVGGALMLCAVAAAISFFAFLPTDYRGLAELGLIAGVGMFVALFANLTILPALLTLWPITRKPRRPETAFAPDLRPALLRHGAVVSSAAFVVGLAALVFVPAARFDFDPLHLKDPEKESVATLFDIMEDGPGNPYVVTVLAPSLEAGVELAKRLEALAPVDRVETLASYVPRDQEEKLAIIQEMGFFLAPSLGMAPRTDAADDGERRKALADIRPDLRRFAAKAGREEARRAASRLDAALGALLEGPDAAAALRGLERRLLVTLPRRLELLRQSLEAEPFDAADLPKAVREREVAADGRARVKVYPKVANPRREELKEFVDAVRSVAPHATGAPVVILESGTVVVRAFRDAGFIAVSVLGLVLAVLLGRGRDIALVFAPLLLAAVLTVAATVLLDLPFNYANVIVLPLLFGLGVANGIHFVLRERGQADVGRVMQTSTPRAVVFSALTTIGSFGSLAVSGHVGTSSMGILLTVAIAINLACTLLVLPALMAFWGKRSRRGAPL